MGAAYELTDTRNGKTFKSLINSRRLKKYVGTDEFEKRFLPILPRKPQIQPITSQATSGQTSAPAESSQSSDKPTIQHQDGCFAAKNVIRQRRLNNQLEFLVRFADNTAQWIKEPDVSDELKRRYFLKKTAMRRRQAKNKRDLFKSD